MQVRIALDLLPSGEYKVEIRLTDHNGDILGSWSTRLLKYAGPSGKGTEVKLDQFHRALLLNGKPFFPVGICSPYMDKAHYELWRRIGFNSVIRWQGIGRNRAKEPAIQNLDVAAQ